MIFQLLGYVIGLLFLISGAFLNGSFEQILIGFFCIFIGIIVSIVSSIENVKKVSKEEYTKGSKADINKINKAKADAMVTISSGIISGSSLFRTVKNNTKDFLNPNHWEEV